jgi:hypothetical protein
VARRDRLGGTNTPMSRSGNGGLQVMTFANSTVATRLPAQDLDRARAFYAEKLGLQPADERPGGLLYSEGNLIGVGQSVR